MTDSLTVISDDMVAGSVTRMPGGRLQFSYGEGYAARPTATPLSLSMPLSQPSHPDSVIAPWLWGLLPDDPSVLMRWRLIFTGRALSRSPCSVRRSGWTAPARCGSRSLIGRTR